MRTGRRPDTITDERAVAERVRKLEVMPLARTINAPKWVPGRDDLYAVAGHIYMLGCFDLPYHTDEAESGFAHVGQAAQYLWATLDQRGFKSDAEAQDWTLFLQRMGAIPLWDRYRPINLHMKETADAAEIAEAHSPLLAPPYGRTAYGGLVPEAGQHVFQGRALYWVGFPGGTWGWVHADDPEWPDMSSYQLWSAVGEGAPRYDEGVFFSGQTPVAEQANVWTDTTTDPDTLIPCGPLDDRYNSSVHKGIPWGPFESGSYPCPGMLQEVPGATGPIYRYRIILPGADLYLAAPPRIQDPALLANDYWHPTLPGGGTPLSGDVGPGLDWLAEGAETLLPLHPHVASFYSQYLPIAYGNKLRAHHYNWQQLDVHVTCRGRVEAHYEPDRVILKGAVHCYSQVLPSSLFHWPDDWAHPAYTSFDGTYLAGGGGTPIGYAPTRRAFALNDTWRASHEGPIDVRLDGTVIPLRLDETLG